MRPKAMCYRSAMQTILALAARAPAPSDQVGDDTGLTGLYAT